MTWFWFGLAAGITLTIPLAVVAARRAARRVRVLEQQARAAERLAELGTLTGGLAHEIKNPLSTIGLNAQLIEEDLSELPGDAPTADANPGPQTTERVSRIKRRFEALARETARLRDILDDFLRYAGRVKLDRSRIDLNTLVDELADFFAPQAAVAGVQLRTQLAASPAEVMGDAALLKQALLNLMINATQSMTDARASSAHGGCDELILRTERKKIVGRDKVLIHVTDTGAGVDPAVGDTIFQPYVSTKSGGTGLGLPTTRRIVEEHGGTVQFHSEPGRGCDFVISLPVGERPLPGPA